MPARASSKARLPAVNRLAGWKIGGWYETIASHCSRLASSTTGRVQSMASMTRVSALSSSPTRRPTLSHGAAKLGGAIASTALTRSATFMAAKLGRRPEREETGSSLGRLGLGGGRGRLLLRGRSRRVDTHRVEAPPDEDEHDDEAHDGDARCGLARNRMLRIVGKLDGQEPEERGELDDGVHRHAARVFEW